jgi:hypothetical protein
MGTAPPDPYTDPKAYLVWLSDEMDRCLQEGDKVGLTRLRDELRAVTERLKLEQADTE